MQMRQKIGKWVLRTWKCKETLIYLGGIITKINRTFLNPKVAGEIRDTLRRLSSKYKQAERNCLWIKHAFARPITCWHGS